MFDQKMPSLQDAMKPFNALMSINVALVKDVCESQNTLLKTLMTQQAATGESLAKADASQLFEIQQNSTKEAAQHVMECVNQSVQSFQTYSQSAAQVLSGNSPVEAATTQAKPVAKEAAAKETVKEPVAKKPVVKKAVAKKAVVKKVAAPAPVKAAPVKTEVVKATAIKAKPAAVKSVKKTETAAKPAIVKAVKKPAPKVVDAKSVKAPVSKAKPAIDVKASSSALNTPKAALTAVDSSVKSSVKPEAKVEAVKKDTAEIK